MDRRLEFLEAAYRFDLAATEQLRTLLGVTARFAELGHGPMLAFTTATAHDWTKTHEDLTVIGADGFSLSAALRSLDDASTTDDRTILLPSGPQFASMSELMSAGSIACLRSMGIQDFVGFNCPYAPGRVVTFGTVQDQPRTTTAGERGYWEPVGSHFAAAWRIRWRLAQGPQADQPSAICDPSGRCLAAGGGATGNDARAALRNAVCLREAARVHKKSGEGAFWPSLVEGRWTIIDRFDSDNRRYVVAYDNRASTRALQALTPREARAVGLAREGESNKVIALDLDVSEATVSRTLNVALRKLGLSLADVMALPRDEDLDIDEFEVGSDRLAVARSPSSGTGPLMALSESERLVVRAALCGQSNEEIARERGRSVRTVVNQLATAYSKLGVQSRRELVLRFARSRTGPGERDD